MSVNFIVWGVMGLSVIMVLEPPDHQPPREPEWRAELLQRAKVDQAARERLVSILKQPADRRSDLKAAAQEVTRIDQDNLNWLKTVLAKRGWPLISQVGEDGANAAWLLIQHADSDPAFQRACLDQITRLPKTEVSQSNVAYLTDRVLIAQGKPQRFGTQFRLLNGRLQPRPIENPEIVDQLRAEMGLSSLAEYAALLEREFGLAPQTPTPTPKPSQPDSPLTKSDSP